MGTRARKPKAAKTRRKASRQPPVEIYTPERMAEFILSNSVDATDYAEAREIVRRDFKLDPDRITHSKPPGA